MKIERGNYSSATRRVEDALLHMLHATTRQSRILWGLRYARARKEQAEQLKAARPN